MIDPVTFICAAVALVSILTPVLFALRNRNKQVVSKDRVIWWLPLFVVLEQASRWLLMTHGIDRLAGFAALGSVFGDGDALGTLFMGSLGKN